MKYDKNEAKAWAKENLRGLGCGIVTPLLKDGEINYDGLKKIVRRALECGSEAIICDGTIGEWITFTVEERKKICTTVVEAVKGRVPVIFGPGHHCVKDVVEMSRHAEEVGADAVMIITPYMHSGSEEAVYSFYRYIADRVNIGIALYNTMPAGFILSARFIAELAEKIPNICAVKEGTQDLTRTLETYRVAGDKIVVGDPTEGYWPQELDRMGRDAFMFCSPVPVIFQTPEKKFIRQYTDLWLKGKKMEALEIYWRLMPLRLTYVDAFAPGFRRTPSVYPVAALKYCHELLGLPGGPVRPPLLPADPEVKAKFRAAYRDVGLLKK